MGEKNDAAKAKMALPWVLKEILTRIRDEILLTAVAFVIILALVIISGREISIEIGVTFVSLYVIAASFYLVKKGKKTKKEIQENTASEAQQNTLKWRMVAAYPTGFPTPLEARKLNIKIVNFPLTFTVNNNTSKTYLAKVYVKSHTQALGYVLDSTAKNWKWHYGIIPYREKTNLSLNHEIELKICPKEKSAFEFRGVYRPLLEVNDFNLRDSVLIQFRLSATSEDKRWVIDTGFKRLELPFKEGLMGSIQKLA
jgi:Ca2+/Na+ antiporter